MPNNLILRLATSIKSGLCPGYQVGLGFWGSPFLSGSGGVPLARGCPPTGFKPPAIQLTRHYSTSGGLPVTPNIPPASTTHLGERKGKKKQFRKKYKSVSPQTMATNWQKPVPSATSEIQYSSDDIFSATGKRKPPSRFIFVDNFPPTTTPADFRYLAHRIGMNPARIVDIYFRYDRFFCPLHKAVLEFDTTAAAVTYVTKNAHYKLAGVPFRMTFVSGKIDEQRLRPDEIDNASGRSVLVHGFPNQTTVEDVRECFRSYEIVTMAVPGVIRLPTHPPQVQATRFIVHLADNREAERLVREMHNSSYHNSTTGGYHVIKTFILY
ncbi:hypothetical protein IWQ62_004722 [Dispira parvispora]|uniref:RRM domain-containing protein n=1 Tax=Dispira parvispora TaxID=1520584 RepID=A0A9W8AP86_9FUNG|nr:hypothetical protein IWQ62_004722 [Dispira parvispora]